MKMPGSLPIYSSRLISILLPVSMVLIISSSCVKDIYIDNADKNLRINITKQSYLPGPNETKTIDNLDYSTDFTAGDKLGIIVSGAHHGYELKANQKWEPISNLYITPTTRH